MRGTALRRRAVVDAVHRRPLRAVDRVAPTRSARAHMQFGNVEATARARKRLTGESLREHARTHVLRLEASRDRPRVRTATLEAIEFEPQVATPARFRFETVGHPLARRLE